MLTTKHKKIETLLTVACNLAPDAERTSRLGSFKFKAYR